MNVSELLSKLNIKYPFIDAESWDNIGLQIGDLSTNVDTDKMFVALDVTSEVLEQVPENSIIVTHHPLFFKGVKSIDNSSYVGKMTTEIIKKGITLICLHTNYDKHFLNRYFVENILEKEVCEADGGLLFYKEDIDNVSDCLVGLQYDTGANKLRFVDSGNIISKIAVCTGSGTSMMSDAKRMGAQLLLTGDVTHHAAIEAKEIGISLVDISHFSSEIYFGTDLVEDMGFKMLKQTNPIEEF